MTRLEQIEERKNEQAAFAKLFGEKVCKLMDISKISNELLAKEIGMSVQMIIKIRSTERTPRLISLIKIADYFAVPMDYFCGRMCEADERAMLTDYYQHFMDIRCARFEMHLTEGSTSETLPDSPWPYNLYFNITKQPIVQALREDQKDGIKLAISMLSEKEQKAVYGRYRDGMTFSEIGKMIDVTEVKARQARQLFMKGMHKLCRPECKKLILNNCED